MFDYFCKAELLTNYPVLCLLSAKGAKARYFFHICIHFLLSLLPAHSSFSGLQQIFCSWFSAPALFNFQIM